MPFAAHRRKPLFGKNYPSHDQVPGYSIQEIMIASERLKPVEPVRILHLTWGLGAGGIQRFLSQLQACLNPHRFDQHICCLREKGLFYHALARNGAHLYYLAKAPGFDIFTVLRLGGLMRRIQPHIVHAHDFTGHFWGLLALRLYGRAILMRTYHDYLWTLSPAKKRIDRCLSLMTAVNIMVSEQQHRHFITNGYRRETSCVIRNGIDITRYRPEGRNEETRRRYRVAGKSVVLGVIGRLVPHKKHDQVILAFKDLIRRFQDCCLLVIGQGPEEARLKALCRELGLNGEVRFIGEIEVGGEMLNLLDIGILLSEGEGSPFTLLEFMAAKVPVIASNVCGINEIISHEEHGLLVPPDNVPALAEAMKRLIEDEDLRSQMAYRSHELLKQNYNIAGTVAALQACYQAHTEQWEQGPQSAA